MNYREKNKDKISEYQKEYREKYNKLNKDKMREYAKKYREICKENISEESRQKRYRQYLNRDPNYNRDRLNCNISGGISRSLKGSKNGHHWEDCVGYTLEKLIKHLERQFKEGMDWNNYGDWHIDHKVPISAFNFTNIEHIDFKRCWALSNLQPLWASDNNRKRDKLKRPFQLCLPIG